MFRAKINKSLFFINLENIRLICFNQSVKKPDIISGQLWLLNISSRMKALFGLHGLLVQKRWRNDRK